MPTGRPKTPTNPNGAGAPSKRTDERRERILAALRAGGTRRAACGAAGISEQTFGVWLRDSIDFLNAVTRAESECELQMVAAVAAAIPEDWRAAAFWLERRRPRDYGKRQMIEVEVRQRAEELAREFDLDPDELIKEAERIAARASTYGSSGEQPR